MNAALKDADKLAVCRDLHHAYDALVLVVTDGKNVQDEVRSFLELIEVRLRSL